MCPRRHSHCFWFLGQSVRLWNLAGVLAKGMLARNTIKLLNARRHRHRTASIGSPAANANDAPPYPRSDPLQYPPHLFPKQTFKMRDGWILGPNDELLLWVPPVNRTGLVFALGSRVMGVVTPS